MAGPGPKVLAFDMESGTSIKQTLEREDSDRHLALSPDGFTV